MSAPAAEPVRLSCHCGSSIMGTGYPDGVVSLNAACIEGVDVFALETERWDGRSKLPPGVLP